MYLTLVSVGTKVSLGDHLTVQLIINTDCIQSNIIYRKYRCINITEFIEDLQSSQHLSNCDGW